MTFWLADRIDERGWGLRGRHVPAMDGLRELGEDVWFNLGDRDLAIWLHRAGGWPPARGSPRRSTSCGARSACAPRVLAAPTTRCARACGRRRLARLPGVHDPRARRRAGRGRRVPRRRRPRPAPEALDAIARRPRDRRSARRTRCSRSARSSPCPAARRAARAPPRRSSRSRRSSAAQVLKGPTAAFLDWAGHALDSDGIAAAYDGLLDGLVADAAGDGLPDAGDRRRARRSRRRAGGSRTKCSRSPRHSPSLPGGRFDANMCSCRSRPTILHADLDAFYASVEQRDDPRLRGRPVIVGGGVVLAASYEAKALRRPHGDGRRGRRAGCARTRSSSRPRMAAYSAASKAVFEVFDDTSPLVEGLSIDEAFLDVRGMERIAGTPREIAVRLRARRARARSACRSPSASRGRSSWPRWPAASPSPTGCSSSRPTASSRFLHPLPVERLWGVGPVTARKLHERGHHHGRRGRAAGRGRARGDARAGRRAASCTRSPTTAIRAGCGPAGGGARWARSARSAAAPRRPPARRRARRRWSTGSPGGCAPRDRVVPDGRAAAALRRLHAARPARTRWPRRPRGPSTILAAARGLLAAAMPLIERQGITLSASR